MQVKYGQEYMRPGIYRIKCNPNNTIYVGQARNLSNRVATHRQNLRKGIHKNSHLQSAYDKYGELAFSVAYLLSCSIEDLTWYEQRVLDIFKKRYRVFNTNAPVDTPMLGRKREYNHNCIQALHDNRDKALEALATIRASNPTYREHMRLVGVSSMKRLRNDPNIEAKRKVNAAKSQSNPELEALRRKQMKDRYANGWRPKRNPIKTPIVDLGSGIKYESYTQAADILGVGVPTIHRWVNGRSDGRHRNYNGKKDWCKYDEANIRHTECRKP